MPEDAKAVEEKKGGKLIPILVVIGGFVLFVALFAASVQWGSDSVVKWIAVPIVLAVLVAATRKFWAWVFSSFRNVKIALVTTSVLTLIAFAVWIGKKLIDLIGADKTPISPAVFLVLAVVISIVFSITDTKKINQRVLALILIDMSALYAYFYPELWLEIVALAVIVFWRWGKIYRKFKLAEWMRVRQKKLPDLKFNFKQAVRLVALLIIPFVVPVVCFQTGDWWKLGVVFFAYFSTIYLGWTFWIRKSL